MFFFSRWEQKKNIGRYVAQMLNKRISNILEPVICCLVGSSYWCVALTFSCKGEIRKVHAYFQFLFVDSCRYHERSLNSNDMI